MPIYNLETTTETQSAVFEVLPADMCMKWLTEKIGTATQEVAVQAMAVQLGERTNPVFEAMERALLDGVDVRCIIDGYSMVFDDDRSIFLPTPTGREARVAVGALKHQLYILEAAGADVAVLQKFAHTGRGAKRYNPYANRNHIKGYAIDDMVALAGPNLQDNATEKYDFMLVTTNDTVADWWRTFTAHESKHGAPPSDKDYKVPIDEETDILVDVGNYNESLIYDTVCNMLAEDDVREVLYVNQMFPAGKILRLLDELQIKLGAGNVTVVTSHYAQFNQPAKALLWLRQKNAKLTFHTPKDKPIHTKTIIITKNSGEKVAIVTSNNLDERGIKYGTAEVAVVTKNSASIQNIENYCQGIPIERFQ